VEKLTDCRDLALSRWQGQFACRHRHLPKDQKWHGKLTIAVGRNLTDRGLADDEIDYLFANNLVFALQICQDLYPSFASFTSARPAALISMAFNLGKPRLAGFRRMRGAIHRDN
jgi:lysozyme